MIFDLCKTLKQMNEKKVACDLIKALARHSDRVEQFDELARTAFEMKDYLLAMDLTEKDLTLAKEPKQIYDIQSNLINSYVHANYPEKAIDIIEQQKLVIPNDRDRELKEAYALFLLSRRDEAESILRRNLESPYTTQKIKTEINFNLGTYEMYRDNFRDGLYRFLIHGREMGNWSKPKLPYKFWDGGNVEGCTLIVMAEAGIGDEFINIRFMRHLYNRNIIPLWFTEREDIRRIFKMNGYDTISSTKNIIDSGNVYWCHSMDLPILLNLEYGDLWYGSYIKSPEILSEAKCFDTDKKKIGVRWTGNAHYDNDLHRSLNLGDLHKVLADDGVQLYSLQRDDGVEDVYNFPDIVPLHEQSLRTFDETLIDINSLDVIVTSCTSIAHASAAMGKRTIVMVPISAYYIWCNSWGEKSPWYGDNITVLRQTIPRDWSGPLQRLKDII